MNKDLIIGFILLGFYLIPFAVFSHLFISKRFSEAFFVFVFACIPAVNSSFLQAFINSFKGV